MKMHCCTKYSDDKFSTINYHLTKYCLISTILSK